MLKKLSTVKDQFGDFRTDWRPDTPDIALYNPSFGYVSHVVACDNQGEPEYDLPVWTEPVGAICVPTDENGNLILLGVRRPVPLPPEAEPQYPLRDISRCGMLSWELPRGFAEPEEPADVCARREVEEEVGCEVVTVTPIGLNNTNTSFFTNYNLVFHVNVRNVPLGARNGQEGIRQVAALPLRAVLAKVAANAIICGMSKSALLHYVARTYAE